MKKIFTLFTIVCSILFLSLPVSALEQKREIIQLDNGYYLETIIEETPTTRASNQCKRKKQTCVVIQLDKRRRQSYDKRCIY